MNNLVEAGIADPAALPRLCGQPTDAPVIRRGVLVLGMHRSGTSAMAGLLGKLGCTLPADLLGPGIGNEKGHWESQGAVTVNDRILDSGGSNWEDWGRFDPAWFASLLYPAALEDARAALRASFGKSPLFVLKDPRICRILPLWLDVFEAEAVDPKIILCLRHPSEVAASLASRDGMELGYAHLLWLRHTLEAEAATRDRRRVICHFDLLMKDWSSLALKISEELGIVWPRLSAKTRHDIDEFFSPDISRNEAVFSPTSSYAMPWADRAYAILKRWAEQGEDRADDAELDHLLQKFDSAADGFSGLIPPGSRSLGAGGGHAMKKALAQAEMNLSAHIDEHNSAIREHEIRLEAALNKQVEIIENTRRQCKEEIGKICHERDEARNEVQNVSDRMAIIRDEFEKMVSTMEISAAERREHQEWLGYISSYLLNRPRWWSVMPKGWQRRHEHADLKQRGLFDAPAYLEFYADVAGAGMDPVRHYLMYGIGEGRRLIR